MPPGGLVVSGVTFAIGVFFFALPDRAARMWGQRLRDDAPHGTTYRRLYRAAGVLLCVAAVLIAMETLLDEQPPPPVKRLLPAFSVTWLTAPASIGTVRVCV